MMTTNTRIKVVRLSVLAGLIVASTLLWAACSPSRQETNSTNQPANTSAQRESASPGGAFALGETRFASQQEFVDRIRPRCATEEPPAAKRIAIINRIEAMRATNPQERAPASVEIPVFFHILTNAAGTEGNITDADVQRQIDVLNEAFAGRRPGGTGTATPFRFVLAGTDRTANEAWFNMSFSVVPSEAERQAKTQLNRPGRSTLNLYTANLSGSTLGWARWPWEIDMGVDGVVILYSTLPGGSQSPYNLGDTATHEVGHWLGLFHTFQGGCEVPGDEVDDTSPERSPASGCPTTRDTCPLQAGGDPVDNFMDYSDDACMFRFTAGQSERMDAAHLRYR
jgi:hypothetical protein